MWAQITAVWSYINPCNEKDCEPRSETSEGQTAAHLDDWQYCSLASHTHTHKISNICKVLKSVTEDVSDKDAALMKDAKKKCEGV